MKNISNNIFTHSISAFFLVFADWPRSVKQWKFHYGMVTYHRLLSALCPSPSPSWPIQLFDTARPFFVFCFFYFLSILTLPKNCCPALPLLALLPTLSPLSWTHMYTIPSSWYGWTYLLLYKLIAAWINIRQSKSGKPGVLGFFTQS